MRSFKQLNGQALTDVMVLYVTASRHQPAGFKLENLENPPIESSQCPPLPGRPMADPFKHYVQYDITWASIALLYYDYMLTFALEVEFIWGRANIFNSGTLLYVLCRYALAANVIYLLGMSNRLTVSCDAWHIITAVLGVLGRAAIIITFTRRAYAVSGQNKWVLGLLSILGVATVVTDSVNVPHQSCSRKGSSSDIIATTRSLLTIVFETLSTILITWRTFRRFFAQRKGWRFRGVEFFIFEQGLLYFCLISLLTIATFILKLRGNSDFIQNLLDAFTLPISGMLTARFMLHLRAWDRNNSIVMDSDLPTSLRGDLDGTLQFQDDSIGKLSFGPNPELVQQEGGEDPMDRVGDVHGIEECPRRTSNRQKARTSRAESWLSGTTLNASISSKPYEMT